MENTDKQKLMKAVLLVSAIAAAGVACFVKAVKLLEDMFCELGFTSDLASGFTALTFIVVCAVSVVLWLSKDGGRR